MVVVQRLRLAEKLLVEGLWRAQETDAIGADLCAEVQLGRLEALRPPSRTSRLPPGAWPSLRVGGHRTPRLGAPATSCGPRPLALTRRPHPVPRPPAKRHGPRAPVVIPLVHARIPNYAMA